MVNVATACPSLIQVPKVIRCHVLVYRTLYRLTFSKNRMTNIATFQDRDKTGYFCILCILNYSYIFFFREGAKPAAEHRDV